MPLQKHQWKGVKQHQKKHNSSQYEKKIGNLFICGTCEKAKKKFGRFILSLSQQQKTLKYAYKSICDICKESFSTLKLLED